MPTHERQLQRRLSPYWKIEMSCAALIPLVVLRSAPPGSVLEICAVGISLLAASLLLLIGGAYWYGVLRRSQGDASPLLRVMRVSDTAESGIVALVAAAWLAGALASTAHGWSNPVIAALACAALATLEYVNYFKVQLQHFDNLADFKRLLRGAGFRRAHLARDLAAFRRASRRGVDDGIA